MDHLLSMEKETNEECYKKNNVLLSFERVLLFQKKFFENWIMW